MMDSILFFFEEITTVQKLIWVFSCLGIGLLLELQFPLFKYENNRLRHLGVNLVFLTTTLIINALFGLLVVLAFNWGESNQFGLFHWVTLPNWIKRDLHLIKNILIIFILQNIQTISYFFRIIKYKCFEYSIPKRENITIV